MFNKNKINSTFFIIGSLTALIVFALMYLFIVNFARQASDAVSSVPDKYYLNSDYKNGDPLITKNPSLRDMLTGPIISSNDPSYGKQDAPVTIVAFSDFECSFCHEQEKELQKVISDNQDQVRLIWKDYPADTLPDSKSYQAAVAGRCADQQGKFWEYHDLLYDNNDNLYDSTFVALATDLELDLEAFGDCRQSEEVRELINDNMLEANALGINGVPFVYVNDQEILGQSTAEELQYLINVELGLSNE